MSASSGRWEVGTSAREWAILQIFAVIFLLLGTGVCASAAGSSGPAGGSLTEMGAMTPIISNVAFTAASSGVHLGDGTIVQGTLSFVGRDPKMQDNVINALYDPGSPLYHHFLTGSEWQSLFGPNTTGQASLEAYLESNGVTVQAVSDLLWNLQGPAPAMGAAFGTTFVSPAASPPSLESYAPVSPLELPARFAGMVQVDDGFQTVVSPQPADLRAALMPVSTPSPVPQVAPSSTALTLKISDAPWTFTCTKAADCSVGTDSYIPAGSNQTYKLTISGGTPPYSVSWHWGDGSIQHFTSSTGTLKAFHMFYQPSQTNYCWPGTGNPGPCQNITVWATDGAGDNGSTEVYGFPGATPISEPVFYNAVTLWRMGFTGQGTTIGFAEQCDKTYWSYQSDLDNFSVEFGLPLTTLKIIGSGATPSACTQSGWADETMLDVDWAHAIAPNATLELDLSNGALDEGDATWNNLTNGVFITSNSWGGNYTHSIWLEAAAQGQTYLTASGDCGAMGAPVKGKTSVPPADNPYGGGVGGTQIYQTPAGTFRAEYAWNGSDYNPCDDSDGSTGGYSTTWAAPWYQIGMTGFNSTYRGVPDFSAIGGTNVEEDQDGWYITCGTSLSSPSFAAMLDLMYQYNGTANRANGLVDYSLYNIAKGANYNTGFHDIVIGNNIVLGVGYNATVGWDPITGLGSPNVGQLAELLANQNGNPDAFSPITPYLASNVSFGPASLNVYFGADAAGGPSSLSGYSYHWDFGDCNSTASSAPFAMHDYANPGIFDATVTVTAAGYAGSGISNTNTIHVAGGSPTPLICSFTASPNTIPANGTTFLNVSAVGGSGPLTFTYTGLPGGCMSSDVASLMCSPARSGTFEVRVFANDSEGTSASAVISLTVEQGLTISSFVASPDTVSPGSSTTMTVVATGGTQPYADYYTGLPAGCASADLASITCVPTATGSFTIRVFVNDSASHSASATTVLTVRSVNGLMSVAVSPAAAALVSGSSQSFTATPRCNAACPPGTTYSWALSNSNMGVFNSTMGVQVTFTAGNTSGTVGLTVNATLNGTTKQSSVVTIIIAVPAVTLSSVAVSPVSTSLAATNTMTFTAVPTCSAVCPSGITYLWTLANTNMGTLSATTGVSVLFTAGSNAGTVELYVIAALNGKTAGFTATITVLSSPSTGSGPSISETTLYAIILVVVAVAAIVAVLVLMRRRKKDRVPEHQGPAPEQRTAEPPPDEYSSIQAFADRHLPIEIQATRLSYDFRSVNYE